MATLATEQSNQQPELNLVIFRLLCANSFAHTGHHSLFEVKKGNWHGHQVPDDTGLGISKGLLKLRLKVTQKNLVRATAGPLLTQASSTHTWGLSPRALEPKAPSLPFSSPAPPSFWPPCWPSHTLTTLQGTRGSPTCVSKSHETFSDPLQSRLLLLHSIFHHCIYLIISLCIHSPSGM